MEAIKYGKIFRTTAFSNPNAIVTRIYLLPNSCPVTDAEYPICPKEDDRLTINAKVGRMIGMRGE